LKRWRFCDAADIIENSTEGLIRLSQNGFQLLAEGDYIERNVA